MSKVSKDKKSEYNRAAYLKRKAKKLEAKVKQVEVVEPEDKIDNLLLDDNVADIPVGSVSPPRATRHPESAPTESEELEISQDDYNKFLQWKNSQTNVEEAKKKIDTDPSYLLNVLKTLGVAVMPALIGVFQRALVKTLDQQTETKTEDPIPYQNGIAPFGGIGNLRFSPLDSPA